MILVSGKPPSQSRVVAAEVQVCDERGRLETPLRKAFRNRSKLIAKRVVPSRCSLVRPSPREKACVRGKSPGGGRTGGVKPHTATGQLFQGRAGRAPVAMKAQMVGTYRIKHDQQDVGRFFGWHRQG